MTSNPDNERRRDCLRKFVLHLSEKGDLAPLVEVGVYMWSCNLRESNRRLTADLRKKSPRSWKTAQWRYQRQTRATSICFSPFTSQKTTTARRRAQCSSNHNTSSKKATGSKRSKSKKPHFSPPSTASSLPRFLNNYNCINLLN